MKSDETEPELPRFSRQIALTRNLLRTRPTGLLAGAIGELQSLTESTENRIGVGHRRFPDLSYLVLRPLVVKELSETVREIPPLTGLRDESRQREELASNDDDPGQFSPLTRLVERTVEKRTGRRPSLTVTNPVERISRTGSFPSTTPLEPRIHRHAQTDAHESAGSRSPNRDSSGDRTVLRERSGDAGLTAPEHDQEPTTRRQTWRGGPKRRNRPAPGFRSSKRGLRTRREDQYRKTPPYSDTTRELVGTGTDGTVDTKGQVTDSEVKGEPSFSRTDNRTRDRVAESPETTGWREFRSSLTTQLIDSRPTMTIEDVTSRRERLQSSTRRAATTVLNIDDGGGDDKSVRGVGSDARTRRGSSLYPARPDTIHGGAPEKGAPSPQRSTGRSSGSTPALIVRTDRASPGSSERDEIEGGRDDVRVNGDTLRERRGDGEIDNSIEQHIYPPESMNSRHMDTDVDIDRLVDRLFTRFERKLRIERERRGL